MTYSETQTIYRSRAWKVLRRAVLCRDLFRCTQCGSTGETGRLEVHHRKPMTQGGAPLDPKNCQTLCSRCHHQIHGDDQRGRKATPSPKPPRTGVFGAWDQFLATPEEV